MIDPQVSQTLEKQGIKKLMFKGNKQKKGEILKSLECIAKVLTILNEGDYFYFYLFLKLLKF